MLTVDSIDVFYGNAQALNNISIQVNKGEIVTIIGANGAGKTTLMMTLSGFLRPRSGKIEFLGKRIDEMESHKIVDLGLIHITQHKNLFAEMTVKENLELGAFRVTDKAEIKNRLEEVYALFNILHERSGQQARFLSGGEQSMLAIGRALMSNTKLMMMDEPSEGLAPIVIQQLEKVIENLRTEKGITVLLVEQNAQLALDLADRGYVLETGVVVATGTDDELASSEIVKIAYLGM